MSLALLVALALAAEPPALHTTLADEEPPASLQGRSSSTLVDPANLRFDEKIAREVPVTARDGGENQGATSAPISALSRYALSVARRHFQDAKWNTSASVGKGREVLIKSVSVVFSQGPRYQVEVTLERLSNGKRLGQAQGSGQAQVDRKHDKARASWAPGPFGRAARNEATKPRLDEDGATIEVATLRALDQALLRLGSAWRNDKR